MRSILLKVVITLLLILIGIYILYTIQTNRSIKKLPAFLPTPTPISLSFIPQNFTDSNQHFMIQYPKNWIQLNSETTQSKSTIFTYTENGQNYTFAIIPPLGNTVPEESLTGADHVDVAKVNYGGHQFLKRLYETQGTPFLLFSSPNEPNFTFYSFSMQLPPTNTLKYMKMFDQILTNMQVNSNFDPNTILNPSPVSGVNQ